MSVIWPCRRAAVAVVAVALVALGSGCGQSDDTSVEGLAADEITPDAIAHAAEEVTSGRIEIITEADSGRSETSGRFDGDDTKTETSFVGPGDAPVTAARSIRVDGRVFVPAEMFGLGESSDDADDVRWVESPASSNSELPGGGGSESEFFEDPFGTMLTAMAEAAAGASPEVIEGEQMLRYVVDLTGNAAVDLSDRLGVTSPGVLPQVGTDDRGAAVEQYREEHTEAEVTAVVDLDGALLEISATIVVGTNDFESCALLPDAGDFVIRMWELGQPQSIEAPPADQVVPAEELFTTTTWQATTGDPAEPNSAGEPPTVPHTTSTTVLGGPGDTFESVDGVPVDPSEVMDVPEELDDELLSGCPT